MIKKAIVTTLSLLIIISTGTIIASCGQEQITNTVTNTTTTKVTTTNTITSTTTATLTVTTATALPTTTTTSSTNAAGDLASYGGTLYNKHCTYIPDCHTKFEGGGGDIQISTTTVSKLDNAETVYGIISDIMHLAIGVYEEKAPTQEQYLQILAYILIQTNLIQPEDLISESILPSILFEAPPETTATPSQTTTTPIMATWGELASRGAGAYTSNCAPCHGEDGGGDFGPEIIGTGLTRWQTAWKLFAFISTNMPQDGPGLLSTTSYQRILAYLLVQSEFVEPEALFDENDLVNVIIE